MSYFLWSLPTLAVFLAIGSGRLDTTRAAGLGLLLAIPIAAFSSPVSFDTGSLAVALARGAWIGATIAPYILGGLLFWQIAADRASPATLDAPPASAPDGASAASSAGPVSALARRRLLFFACFLVGPFAESATGFGVGMLGTVALIRPLGIAPRELMIFALFSQTMIPWGAMGSGTLLAAAYARIPANLLGVYSVIPVLAFLCLWMPLFWRIARASGLDAPFSEILREIVWIGVACALLAPATYLMGPETALLAVYGPLIVIRYLSDVRPDRQRVRKTAKKSLPYIVLIACLVLTRLVPAIKETLVGLWAVRPFADLPAWSPLFHAGSWLFAGGVSTALLRGRTSALGTEFRSTWATGRQAVLAVFLFAMLAEVMLAAGISQAFAAGTFATLREGTLLVTPLVSSALGILSNSGSPASSLFMASLVALAGQAGLSVAAVATLQHVAGTSMSMVSPIRLSIAAGLARGVGQERAAYRLLGPYLAGCIVLLEAGAVLILLTR